MLKQTQQLKQTQRLSPLQIQTIKLIELPAPELEQRIQKELEENPVLEEVVDDSPESEEKKNVSLSEYSGSDPTPSYKLYVNNQGKDLKPQYKGEFPPEPGSPARLLPDRRTAAADRPFHHRHDRRRRLSAPRPGIVGR